MSQARERIERMYTLFPRLGERKGQDAGTMSGGERQMVAMAKALMPDPSVILLDEPSAGLAPAFVDAIFEKIADVNSEGVTILMVEQNATRALAMSDRGYVLDLGKERFEGPGKELIADPKVAELYLGGGSRIDDAEDVAEVLGDDSRDLDRRGLTLTRRSAHRRRGLTPHCRWSRPHSRTKTAGTLRPRPFLAAMPLCVPRDYSGCATGTSPTTSGAPSGPNS